MSSSSSSSEEEDRRQDVFARLQELRAGESDAKRKRREEVLGRVQLRADQRRQTSSLVSSARLDLSEVHSKISGPRLTWDFGGDASAGNDLEIDADRFGGSGSRAALDQHIKQQLSQAHAKQLARQIQSDRPPPTNSRSMTPTDHVSMSSEEELPDLIPVSPTAEVTRRFPPPEDIDAFTFCAATQPFLPASPRSDATEPVAEPDDPRDARDARRRVLHGPLMSDSNLFDFSAGLRSQRLSEASEAAAESEASQASEGVAEEVSEGEEVVEAARPKLTREEKDQRRAERKKRKKELRRNLRGFLEEAAEESDDEEFATFTRKRRNSEEEISDSSDSEAADVEGLVASEDEERRVQAGAQKDKRKLSKLHGQWAEERDKELEERAERGEFRKRRKMDASWGEDGGGLTRRERIRRTKYDSNGERILSSESEGSEGEGEGWLTEEEDEWGGKEKKRKKKETIKKISDAKILRQQNIGFIGASEKTEYENSVKEVNVFGAEKNSSASFPFLTQKKSVGFR